MPNLNGERVTIREVYQLVNESNKTVQTQLDRLEGKFDALEAGRLTRLETEFANLQGKLAVIAGVVSIVVSISAILISKLVK